MVSTIIFLIGMFLTDDVNVMIAVLIGIGFASSSRLSLGFVYMMEFIPLKHQIYLSVV